MGKVITTVIIIIISTLVYFSTDSFDKKINLQPDNYKGADYVREYCSGEIEHFLEDKTGVDCLTDEYAIEFDYAKKWAESIGQSLYYLK